MVERLGVRSSGDGSDWADPGTDPNGNGSMVAFDALGQVTRLAAFGDGGEGDALGKPTAKYEYSLTAWKDHTGPNWARARLKETHGDHENYPLDSYTYIDGFGRAVLTKATVADGPAWALGGGGNYSWDETVTTRWLGSGRVVYDNKGNPKKQYEPYFSRSSGFEDGDKLAAFGVTPVLHYDPLGRLWRSDLPDGTISRTTFNAWEQRVFDGNDTLGDDDSTWLERPNHDDPAEERASTLAQVNINTPTVSRLDVLGRVYETYGILKTEGDDEASVTRTALDIQGNALRVFDANAVAHDPNTPASILDQDFDLLGRVVHADSLDAGESFSLLDAADQPVWHKEPRGAISVTDYDELHRPSKRTVTPPGGHAAFVSERYVYGEDGSAGGAADNQLGRLFRMFDQAGKVTYTYDFKGNIATSARQLIANIGHRTAVTPSSISPALLQVADWADSPNYTAPVDASFDPLVTTTTYDALNRPATRQLPARDPLAVGLSPPQTPADPNLLAYAYDKGGQLYSVEAYPYRAANAETIVASITYNEKQQRDLVTFGHGGTTKYNYDPLTFRLTHLVTKKSGGEKLQDLTYTYDAVGNIVQITDDAQDTIYFNNNAVRPASEYEYDTLYRLTSAVGREHWSSSSPPTTTSQDFGLRTGSVLPEDGQAMTKYVETYAYDLGGNIEQVTHAEWANPSNKWTRTYSYVCDGGDHTGNRLLETTAGSTETPYTHDAAGNMTAMPHLAAMDWDERQQLTQVAKADGDLIFFVYDASGQRVRKVVVHVPGEGPAYVVKERVYVEDYEFYREYNSGGVCQLERETVHVMDDQRRVAIVEQRTVSGASRDASSSPVLRYQHDNHLGTACVETDAAGEVISYEEYLPYGATSYRAGKGDAEVSLKRYRYTGKERDEETGFTYHGARYYAPWLARWTSADPEMERGETNSFEYVNARPIVAHDPDGRAGWIGALVGGAVGALVGGGAAVAVAAWRGEKIDARKVAAAAAAGAVAGAITGATMGLNLVVGGAAVTVGKGAAGSAVALGVAVASNVAGGTVGRQVTGDKTTATGVALDAAVAVAGYGVGRALGAVAKPIAHRVASLFRRVPAAPAPLKALPPSPPGLNELPPGPAPLKALPPGPPPLKALPPGPPALKALPAAADFAPGQLDSHFEKHAAEWGVGNITKSSYLNRARGLLDSAVGGNILEKHV